MSRRSAAYALKVNEALIQPDDTPDQRMLSGRVEHFFPIRWETFQEDLHKDHGFVDFLIVDDCRSYNLWDELLTIGISRLGIRPEGYTDPEGATPDDLPEGKWRMLHAIRALAADELYARAGVTKPCSTKLPAIYCLVHGEVTGSCVFNVQLDAAVSFIKDKIEILLVANGNRC